MNKTLFKRLYRDYRIAQKTLNKTGDNSLILTYMNCLGNSYKAYKNVCIVQDCYIKSTYGDTYTPVSQDYVFFMFTK